VGLLVASPPGFSLAVRITMFCGYVGMELWQAVASAIGCGRVAKKCCAVSADDFRSPNIKLLLGSDAWVEQIDNGIRFGRHFTR